MKNNEINHDRKNRELRVHVVLLIILFIQLLYGC